MAQEQVDEPTYDCSLSERVSLHNSDTVFMQEYVNTDRGTFKMRIRYTAGESWIGVGVNTNNEGTMAPAYAVIGMIDETGSPSVQRYWIDEAGQEGIIPLDDPNGHLKMEYFHQENGETFFEFEHDLVIMENGAVTYEIGSDSVWIYAVGPDNNDWGSRHRIGGSFTLALSDNCVARFDTDETATTPAPSADSTQMDITTPDSFPAPVPTMDEPTWSSGTTEDEDVVGESSLQSSSSSLLSSQGLWVTHGLFMAFAWGLLAPLAIGATVFRNRFTFLSTNNRWFKIHTYLNVAIAVITFFGFFFAVGAARRDGSSFKAGPAHNKVGLTIFLFVLMQVAAGYYRPSSPGDPTKGEIVSTHKPKSTSGDGDCDSETVDAENLTRSHSETMDGEKSDKDPKDATDPTEAGVEMSLLQDKDGEGPTTSILEDDDWSLFTPPPPPPLPTSETATTKEEQTSIDGDGNDDDDDQENERNDKIQRGTTNTTSKSLFAWSDRTEETKKLQRQMWKYGHRIMGIILLGMAWYNCQTGIVLLCTNFFSEEKEEELLNIYWGIAGTIACVYLFVGYILRD